MSSPAEFRLLELAAEGLRERGTEKEWGAWQERFRQTHFLVLRNFLEAGFLGFLQAKIEKAHFYAREHGALALEKCMEENLALNLLQVSLNDPRLLQAVSRLTAEPVIGYFDARVYKMEPGGAHFDSWHDDLDGNRLLALSINLGKETYEGGALQLRELETGRILTEVSNTRPGDALLFRLSESLQHQVTPVTGAAQKISCAGWFERHPGEIKFLDHARQPLAQTRFKN